VPCVCKMLAMQVLRRTIHISPYTKSIGLFSALEPLAYWGFSSPYTKSFEYLIAFNFGASDNSEPVESKMIEKPVCKMSMIFHGRYLVHPRWGLHLLHLQAFHLRSTLVQNKKSLTHIDNPIHHGRRLYVGTSDILSDQDLLRVWS
jgi:hypothetical protein